MKKANFKAEQKINNGSFPPFPFGIPFIRYHFLELAHCLLQSLTKISCWDSIAYELEKLRHSFPIKTFF